LANAVYDGAMTRISTLIRTVVATGTARRWPDGPVAADRQRQIMRNAGLPTGR